MNISQKIQSELETWGIKSEGVAGALLGAGIGTILTGGTVAGIGTGAVIGHYAQKRGSARKQIVSHRSQVSRDKRRLQKKDLTANQRELYKRRILAHTKAIEMLRRENLA